MGNITQDFLKKHLHYCPDTGVFTWVKSTTKRPRIGAIAGTLTKKGYISIGLEKRRYLAHRLAWLYVYGTFPKDQIDHINRIKTDNRIENLRECSNHENHQNKINPIRPDHLTGTCYFKRTGKWVAYIDHKGKRIHLGYYMTQEEAHKEYLKAKKAYHTFNPTVGEALCL